MLVVVASVPVACTNIGMKKNMNNIGQGPIQVETYEVHPTTITKTVDAVGTLESPQTTELTSEVGGKIVFLNIPEGSVVSKDTIIAKIDSSTTQAELKVVQAKLKNAQDNYKRMESLKERGAISQQTLDNAVEGLHTAEGEVERVESILTMTDITAPFFGVLSLRKISLGAYVDKGDVIVRISQVTPLHLLFSLPEQFIPQVMLGQVLNFTTHDLKKEFTGKVFAIDPYIDKETRTVQIKAEVKNPNKEMLPGEFANVKLHIERASGITIPQEALIQENNLKTVFKLTAENTVASQEVTTREWSQNTIEVLSGLMDGDVIVTLGHQKLFPGAKVIPTMYKPIQNKNLEIGKSKN